MKTFLDLIGEEHWLVKDVEGIKSFVDTYTKTAAEYKAEGDDSSAAYFEKESKKYNLELDETLSKLSGCRTEIKKYIQDIYFNGKE